MPPIQMDYLDNLLQESYPTLSPDSIYIPSTVSTFLALALTQAKSTKWPKPIPVKYEINKEFDLNDKDLNFYIGVMACLVGIPFVLTCWYWLQREWPYICQITFFDRTDPMQDLPHHAKRGSNYKTVKTISLEFPRHDGRVDRIRTRAFGKQKWNFIPDRNETLEETITYIKRERPRYEIEQSSFNRQQILHKDSMYYSKKGGRESVRSALEPFQVLKAIPSTDFPNFSTFHSQIIPGHAEKTISFSNEWVGKDNFQNENNNFLEQHPVFLASSPSSPRYKVNLRFKDINNSNFELPGCSILCKYNNLFIERLQEALLHKASNITQGIKNSDRDLRLHVSFAN